MTALQFKEYVQEIAGKPVRQEVKIGNVEEDGKISLVGPWSPILFNIAELCVIITGAPKDVALSLSGGDKVQLEALINGIVGDYNYYNNCENVLLLTYKKIEP